MRQTDPTGEAVCGPINRADDEHPAHRATPALPLFDQVVRLAERHVRLVDFDQGLEAAPAGVGHRAAALVQEGPVHLVAAEAQPRLKLERRHAVGMAGSDVGGKKPRLEPQVAAVHHRADGHQGLASAVRIFPGRPIMGQCPALASAANRADEPVRQPSLDQIPRAGRSVGKERLERFGATRDDLISRRGTGRNNTGTCGQRQALTTTWAMLHDWDGGGFTP